MTGSEPGLGRRQFLTGAARRVRQAEILGHWHAMDTRVEGLGVLWGAWGSAPDDVYIAGDDGVMLHWDGQCWARQSTGTRLPLHAVWGPGPEETFAVGWMGVICHRRDGAWRQIQGTEVDPLQGRYASSPVNQPLFALWGAHREDIWAVGDNGRVVRFDGQIWHEKESGLGEHLRTVAGLEDGSVLAGGMRGLIARCDGQSWSVMETGTKVNFTRIWVRARDDIYAVGGEYTAAANRFVGKVFRFDGVRWRELEADLRLERLRSITGDGLLAVAAGDRGSLYLIDGDRISPLASGTHHDLLDIVHFEHGAIAAGDFGTVLSTGPALPASAGVKSAARAPDHPSAWEVMPHGLTDRVLWSVWGCDARNVFAVGESGTIVHFDGHAWSRMQGPTRVHLHGVWGTSGRNVYAVGQQGVILHYDGQVWREAHRLGVDVTAVAITGFGAHEIFVVGDEGLVLVFDGASWQRVTAGTKNALYAVWGLDAQHLLAVGDFGTVLRYNGQRWDEFDAGTESFLYGVWGDALDNVHVVGQSGCALRFDGKRWRQQLSRQRCDLLAVAGCRGHAPLAAGTLGTLLVRHGEQWIEEGTDCEASLRSLWMADDGTAFAAGDGGTLLRRAPP